jgi:RNA recognition motif-containing protein
MTTELSDKENQNLQPEESQQQELISKEENTQILINNIPEMTTEEDLRNKFEKFGKILKIKFDQDDINGKPAKTAIIDFETKEEKKLALNSNEDFEIEGKKIEIKDPSVLDRTLFVGNVPYTSTVDDIKLFFNDCGKVIIKPFFINERFKGYAHVTFEDENAVEIALKKNGEKIGDREIKIDRLRPRNFTQMQRGGRRGGFRGGRGRGGQFMGHFDRERKDYYYRERRDNIRERDRDNRYRERDWDRGRPYNRYRDRDRERERERDWNRDRRERSRDRSREYNRMRERNDRERGERERHRDFERDNRDKDRERGERERERDRGERDRGNRDEDRHRDMEKERRHSNYNRENGYRERD